MSNSIGRYDDSVLRLATLLVRIAIVFCWVAVVAIAIVVPLGLTVWRAELSAQLLAAGLGQNAFTAMIIAGAGAALILILTSRFLGRLLAIMRTVDQGDPFVPENADRLRAMAWLLLAIELIGFGLGILARSIVGESKGFEFSVTGLIAVLSLFVLARVFTRGTEMRDEIEGTI